MSRPLKDGLDYFSLDCYMDSKIKLIQAEYGLKGFAIVVKLWQMIYREYGYYGEWDEEKAFLFAHEECSDCGVKLLNAIIETCFRRGIFSRELFDKYQILTSRGIQKRYFEAVSRRKKRDIKEEYLLVKFAQKQANEVETPVNVSKNSINDYNNTQSKVKKSKGKESRVENTRTRQQSDSELYANLCAKYGRSFVDERVERSKQYKGTNMQTVAKWCEEDFGKKPVRKRNGFCNFRERDNDYAELQRQSLIKDMITKPRGEENK